jgi:DNA-binding CsgD family transcriptional regulator/tetratricopeptide (TPR) repeat protein
LCESEVAPELDTRIRTIWALQNLDSGRFSNASQHLNIILNSDLLTANDRSLYENNLASCLTMMGTYTKAKEIVTKTKMYAEAKNEEQYLPLINDTLAVLAATDILSDGINMLKETIEDVTEKSIGTLELCMFHRHLGTMKRRNGEYDAALKYHKKGLGLAKKHERTYDVAMSKINIGSDYLRINELLKAEECFDDAEEIAINNDYLYCMTQIDYHRAHLSILMKNRSHAIENLRWAFERASKYQQNHFIIQEGKINLPLFELAIDNLIETDYVFWILEQIGISATDVVSKFIGNKNRSVRLNCLRYFEKLFDPRAINLLRTMQRDVDLEIRNLSSKIMSNYRKQNFRHFDSLTNRENQILEMIAAGASNARISSTLFISETTVKTHVTHILRKLGLNNRLEAALFFQNEFRVTTVEQK